MSDDLRVQLQRIGFCRTGPILDDESDPVESEPGEVGYWSECVAAEPEEILDVLSAHYEHVMHNLAAEMTWCRRRLRGTEDMARDANRRLDRAQRLLLWLRETYEFDPDVVEAIEEVVR